MQPIFQGLRRSASIKALVIGGLILVLLIPVSMIEGVIHDRDSVHLQARYDIMRSWGGEQLIAGPVLVVPYTLTYVNVNGHEVIEENRAYVLPAKLEYRTTVNPEIRYRGIHKVPIYGAAVSISGEFDRPNLGLLGIERADLDWDKAHIAVSVADARAITETPMIDVGDESTRFEPGGASFMKNMAPPIVATVGNIFEDDDDGPRSFSMQVQLNGSDSVRFTPLGDTTRVAMSSDWASPSFIGDYLPETREISDDGFTAAWQISSLGRSLPSQWTGSSALDADLNAASFGVSFYMPVSLYQLTLRASKYAILFIGLSFVAYFLFEVMLSLRLHPLQYLLVGFANALFYLLLLSLAEHTGFGLAYLASAAASISLISGYSVAVLGKNVRGLIMAAVLAGLYGFLYMTLKAESFALLAGAMGLWLSLAIIMYLTRRIDWYAYSKSATDD